jgi:rSAM/selenodomain-associated transferase 2/rSAM/selenodomain-associated transferase 1
VSLCIVVPVLNEGASLADRLAALRPLRQRGAQVVVVDGGSTDETWAIACRHADRVLLAPRGRAAQMNAGAEGARAQVLLFLHADTALPPRADEAIAAAMAAGAEWGRFDVRIDGRSWLLRIVAGAMNLRSRLTGIATGDQAIFVRRQRFEQLGGFAPIDLMEDVALSARLRRIGRPACLRPPVFTSARRWERHGIFRTILLMWQLRARYFLGADPSLLARRYGYERSEAPPPAAIAILAKAPVPGLAKTRLAPGLGAQGAARAQRLFTQLSLVAARQAGLGSVALWCAPDASHRFFRALARVHGTQLLAQPTGDLGARLRAAVAHHFAQGDDAPPLLIMGTDCPLLSPGHLHEAARVLALHDAVLVPAEDGGYALLGMRRPLPEVFAGIDWSTPQVLQQTRDRLAALGARWRELAPLWDVDEPADWQRYQKLIGRTAGLEPSHDA